MLELADFPRTDRRANPARGGGGQGFLAQISSSPQSFCRRTGSSSPALFQDSAGYKLVLEKIMDEWPRRQGDGIFRASETFFILFFRHLIAAEKQKR
jgi:hypothetical protein